MIPLWHFCLLYEKPMFKITLIAAVLIAASAATFAQTATPAVPAAAAGKAPAKAEAKADVKATDAMPAVKKSNKNVCHDASSSGYLTVKKFTPYASMEECIASGGHARKPSNPAKK